MRTINIVTFVLLGLLIVSHLFLTLGPCWSADYAACGLGRGIDTVIIDITLILAVIILSIISFATRNKSK